MSVSSVEATSDELRRRIRRVAIAEFRVALAELATRFEDFIADEVEASRDETLRGAPSVGEGAEASERIDPATRTRR